MPRIPGINHQDAVRALQKAGFRIARQGKHIVMTDDKPLLLHVFFRIGQGGSDGLAKASLPPAERLTWAASSGMLEEVRSTEGLGVSRGR